MDGTRVYFAGDTDFIPEMKSVRCDIALLPVSGTYVMTAEEAAEAAAALRPKIAVPMHYAAIVGSDADAKKFKSLVKRCEVVLV
jgi:L-ascorbate metabolism protein UlaG (beta-lactamase superfamily)